MIIQCGKCGVKNRVADISPNKRPICGRCKEPLNCVIDTTLNRNDPQKKKPVLNVILVSVFIIEITVICLAPLVIGNNYSNLIASENEKVQIHEGKLKEELADYENTMKSELERVNPEELHAEAFKYYKILVEKRKSREAQYALTPREKTLLKMKNISMDSTKNYLDAIREIAKEASPKSSKIDLKESVDGLILSIDFQMSIVSSGEEGVQTKHDTTKSLKEEVVTLTSRVATDLFNFCDKLDLKSIYIGCKHDVITENSMGVRGTEEMVLYKVKIDKNKIATLSGNPFLNTYSITSNLNVEEDHFDEVSIIKERK